MFLLKWLEIKLWKLVVIKILLLRKDGWKNFKKKFVIRINNHKNKNFKKIISFKEKVGKINDNISYDEKDKESIKYQDDDDDSKNNYTIGMGDTEQKKINEKESDNSDNDAENE